MSQTPLKQQLANYSSLFKQLFSDYYSHQKKLFWLVQLLIAISTLSGLFWMLSLILGISHYQNPTNTEGFKYLLFSWVFNLPLWQWLLLASIAGIISAWTNYLSIQIGVKSVLQYQKYLSQKCLKLVSNDEYSYWTSEFSQNPRSVLLRLLRQGVQLSGLVARRISLGFISLIVFICAFMVLIYLDSMLLALLLPLSFLYIIALYFINRYAARVSTLLADNLPVAMSKFNQLVTKVLNKSLNVESQEFQQQFDDSTYMYQAELKYKRRLAEIHVSWLNSLFLVIGIAIIIIYLVYIQTANTIDWQHLLFFLIALRYAASSLQQISSTTVAFSRFLPETQYVYRLLNIEKNSPLNPISINEHAIIYIPSNTLDAFEIKQLALFLNFSDNVQIATVADIREQGMITFFKTLPESKHQIILIDNKLERLKQIVNRHKNSITHDNYYVFSNQIEKIQALNQEAFLNHRDNKLALSLTDDMDAFE